ncbi:myo-inositol-1(or 4)-monophosphatase [Rhizobium tibeticum]|uniref:Myo-inositol-1(Or 4)-monophosphatase n=1 Tax=Rhizobium tibeticum TaxID=501024 RepID=A0A1H8L149_9HYPH|nr:hypothetical protein RTCCBAU85039_2698 [Rhizobium tibeticum]SEN98867.1 myo-inositol-1(or 4)-monophosphatase [Rhizobium tibeticum]
MSSKGIEDVLVGAGLPIPGKLKAVPEDVYFSALKRLMATTAGVRRLGSAALSIAYVALRTAGRHFRGWIVIARLRRLRPGGAKQAVVSAFNGGPVTANGDVLAGNRVLHPWLVEGFQACASIRSRSKPTGSSVVIWSAFSSNRRLTPGKADATAELMV